MPGAARKPWSGAAPAALQGKDKRAEVLQFTTLMFSFPPCHNLAAGKWMLTAQISSEEYNRASGSARIVLTNVWVLGDP